MLQPTTPVSVGGYGTIAVTTSSVAISTAVAGVSSGAYPTSLELPSRVVTLWNSANSANTVFMSPLGGTATSSCIPLLPGATAQWLLPGATTPSVVSDGTATLFVIW